MLRRQTGIHCVRMAEVVLSVTHELDTVLNTTFIASHAVATARRARTHGNEDPQELHIRMITWPPANRRVSLLL